MTGAARLAGALTLLSREARRRLHRQLTLCRGLAARVQRLQSRMETYSSIRQPPLVRQLDPAFDRSIDEHRRPGRQLALGEFDQDGGILPRFAAIAGLPCVGQGQFNPRKKYRLTLVDVDGRLGVRKKFGARRGRFVQELEAMVDLGCAGCAVPPLVDVDWAANAITCGFVAGEVLRETLARSGARVRDRDVSGAASARDARIRSARTVLDQAISDSQIRRLAEELNAIHRAGYVFEDIKYGNIIIEAGTGLPVFLDLERALPIKRLSVELANYLVAIDWRKFREHFGDGFGPG